MCIAVSPTFTEPYTTLDLTAVSLFRPYIKLDLRGAGLYPKDACTFYANEISALMNALRAMYGLRRVCLSVTSFAMSACTIHLLNLPSEQSAAHLTQGLQDLQAMSINHQFAARCVEIIRSLAVKWDIALPETAATVLVFRGADSRPWSSPPPSTFFAASIPRQQSAESGTKSGSSVSSRQDGPFNPPRQSQQSQPFSPFYSDPSTPLDPSQTQTTFWTPFPVQGFPTQSQDWNNVMFDFPGQLNGAQEWPMFGGSAVPQGNDQTSHEAAPGGMGEGMRGAMGDWSWQ